jgi:hypothetical protein
MEEEDEETRLERDHWEEGHIREVPAALLQSRGVACCTFEVVSKAGCFEDAQLFVGQSCL